MVWRSIFVEVFNSALLLNRSGISYLNNPDDLWCKVLKLMNGPNGGFKGSVGILVIRVRVW